jgi:hypothetical protein
VLNPPAGRELACNSAVVWAKSPGALVTFARIHDKLVPPQPRIIIEYFSMVLPIPDESSKSSTDKPSLMMSRLFPIYSTVTRRKSGNNLASENINDKNTKDFEGDSTVLEVGVGNNLFGIYTASSTRTAASSS